LFEHRRLLKLPSDAGSHDFRLGYVKQIDVAAEPSRPWIRAHFSRDDVHHGGLAGAVGADDAEQFSRGMARF
jgi:hypothetical protein